MPSPWAGLTVLTVYWGQRERESEREGGGGRESRRGRERGGKGEGEGEGERERERERVTTRVRFHNPILSLGCFISLIRFYFYRSQFPFSLLLLFLNLYYR